MSADDPDARAGATAAAELDRILREQAQAFDRNLAAMQLQDDPEHPHKARVALRRLRSALKAFGPILDADTARKLSRRARALFRILGPLREADVAAASFASDHDRDELVARAAARRAETRQSLEAAQAAGFAARVAGLLDAGGLVGSTGPASRLGGADPRLLADLALQQAWTEVMAFGPSVASLDIVTRHEFRKDMKTLRYVTEFFAPEGGKKRHEKFVGRLAQLQDALGELNDIAEHAGDQPLDNTLQDRADRAMKAAETHWAKLRKQGPWWTPAR